jgi:hypothetical protein
MRILKIIFLRSLKKLKRPQTNHAADAIHLVDRNFNPNPLLLRDQLCRFKEIFKEGQYDLNDHVLPPTHELNFALSFIVLKFLSCLTDKNSQTLELYEKSYTV